MRIRIREVDGNFEAFVITQGERFSSGQKETKAEAVGILLINHAEVLGVQFLDETASFSIGEKS